MADPNDPTSALRYNVPIVERAPNGDYVPTRYFIQQWDQQRRLNEAFARGEDPVTEDFTVYVSNSGNDEANDGLTPDAPFSTINRAIELVASKILSGFIATISVEPGNYPENVRLPLLLGGFCFLVGAGADRADVNIEPPSGDGIFCLGSYRQWTVDMIRVAVDSSSSCIRNNGYINVRTIEFGPGRRHFFSSDGTYTNVLTGDVRVTGDATDHIQCARAAFLTVQGTPYEFVGAITFSRLVNVTNSATVIWRPSTVTGSFTGQTFRAQSLAFLAARSDIDSFGTIPGTVSTGATSDPSTFIAAGTFGSATQVPQITTDGYGRVSNVTEVPVSGGGGGALVAAIRDDGNISDTTAAAFKGNIVIPTRDITISAIYVAGQSDNGDDYQGFVLELDGSNQVQTVSSSDVYTATFTQTLSYVFTHFSTPVTLTAGTRYAIGVSNQTDGDATAFLAIEGPTTSETSQMNAPLQTVDGCALAKMTPAVSDTMTVLPTSICETIHYTLA